eukprot:GSChrysophyteH1.ASY1.ANO1.656.1 assembled CDS
MGINGLAKLLESIDERSGQSSHEDLEACEVLVIDANGFVMWIASNLFSDGVSRNDGAYNYEDFTNKVYELLEVYLATQLRLDFYFDGNKTKCKEHTKSKRQEQNDDKRDRLISAANGGRPCDVFIPPVLVTAQLLHILNDFNHDRIRVMHCEYEADQDIAIAVSSYNQSGVERAIAYASDSDFLAMKLCPYVKFPDLLLPGMGEGSNSNGISAWKVWRREQTAQMLHMSEKSLIDLCILTGNDFTNVAPRRNFDTLLEQGFVREPPRYLTLLKVHLDTCGDAFVRDDDLLLKLTEELSGKDKSSLPTHFGVGACQKIANLLLIAEASETPVRISSQHEDLQLAIDYSRAFYDLLPLNDGFKEDSSSSPARISPYRISDIESEHIMQWIQSSDSSQLARGVLGDDMYRYLIEAVRKHKMYRGGENSSVTIKDKHLTAFRLLRELYYVEKDEENNVMYDDNGEIKYKTNGYGDYDIGVDTVDLDYENILIGWFLEKLYLKFYNAKCNVPELYRKSFLKYSYEGYVNSPLMTYNGYLFHSIVKQLEVEEKEKKIKKAAKNGKQKSKGKNTKDANSSTEAEMSDGKEVLPIDHHKERILKNIETERVTIIHGETGCGKSSRVPLFLLESAEVAGKKVRMFVCQPRRIAATSLMKRLRVALGEKKIALRLGNGYRDGDTNAPITFATTGYLVRLMAHHPEKFEGHTHLIIDEVHERSVDGDLICYFSRLLLLRYPNLKLVLMSATADAGLYQSYFEDFGLKHGIDFGDLVCLKVGARRFPVEVKYLDDIANATFARSQIFLAVSLIESIGVPGSGILVFVSGMSDIMELLEKLESYDNIVSFPLHGDLPDEEQMSALGEAPADKVKVIISTNIAESSLTIPDVDMIICLGAHKQFVYQAKVHRAILENSWISQASAVQRAGRTGRVRPGKVFRLYTEEQFLRFEEHDSCEVLVKPLQDTILTLRYMMQDSEFFQGCIPILEDLLEPPPMSNINRSFEALHQASMIISPDDRGELTSAGYFAAQVPVDLEISKLILYGVLLDVGAEAAILAAALSQPKTVFKQRTRFFCHNPDYLHAVTGEGLLGALDFDSGMYSGPLSLLALYIHHKSLSLQAWLDHYSLSRPRVMQFITSANSLVRKTNEALKMQTRGEGMSSGELPVLPENILNRLRLILFLSNDYGILQAKTLKRGDIKDMREISLLEKQWVTKTHVANLFPVNGNVDYAFKVEMVGHYQGKISPARKGCDMQTLLKDLVLSLVDHSGSMACAYKSGEFTAIAIDINEITEIIECDIHTYLDILEVDFAIKVGSIASSAKGTKKCVSGSLEDLQHASAPGDKIFKVFVEGKSTGEKKALLARLHNSCQASSINFELFPQSTTAEIMVYNAAFTEEQLQFLFWKGDTSGMTTKELGLLSTIHSSSKTQSGKQERRKSIWFNDPVADYIASFKAKSPGQAPLPLLNDIPLGMRIIKACMSKYKGNNSLMLWIEPPADLHLLNKSSSRGSLKSCPWPDPEKKVTHEVDAKAPVVGSAAYAAAKASAATSKGESLVNVDAGWQNKMEKLKRELSLNPVKLKWFCDRGYKDESPVVISGETPVAVAVHCAPNALFALGHHFKDIGCEGGKILVICGDATVCPPGMRWIDFASIIAGLEPIEEAMVNRDLLQMSESNVELKDHCKYINSRASGYYETFIAEHVRDVLEGSFASTNRQVLRKEDVIHLIDYLFGYWAYPECPTSQLWKDLSRADIIGGNDEVYSQRLLEEARKLSINSLRDRQSAAKHKKIGIVLSEKVKMFGAKEDRAAESDTESSSWIPTGSESDATPSGGDLEVDCYVMSEDELKEMEKAGDKNMKGYGRSWASHRREMETEKKAGSSKMKRVRKKREKAGDMKEEERI